MKKLQKLIQSLLAVANSPSSSVNEREKALAKATELTAHLLAGRPIPS